MKTSRTKLAFLLLLAPCSAVSAQQQCEWRQEGPLGPAWYQPGGWSACNSSAESIAPRAHWATRWGAIASSHKTNNVGVISGQKSRGSAERIAMEKCGVHDCKVDMAYHDQCAVIAWGTGHSAIASAVSIEEASRIAMNDCGKAVNDCKVVYSDCSLPELIQ